MSESNGNGSAFSAPLGGGAKRGSPRGRLGRAQLRHQCIQMTLAGATQDEIAAALGVTRARVSKVVNRLLEEWEQKDKQKVEQIRELQLRRLDRLERAIWNKAIGVDVADDGTTIRRDASLKHIGEIRKLEALRARIAGTEAPKRVEMSGEVFVIDQEEDDRLLRAWAHTGGAVIEGEATELRAAAAELPERAGD